MHWLESDGCCKAVVIETSIFFVVWRVLAYMVNARFSPWQDPHPGRGLLPGTTVGRFVQFQKRKNIDKKRCCQRSKVNCQSQKNYSMHE
jgi:hypothetical protein